jgi:hypothetical protein
LSDRGSFLSYVVFVGEIPALDDATYSPDVRNIGIHALANWTEISTTEKVLEWLDAGTSGELMDIGERELRPWVGAESSRS